MITVSHLTRRFGSLTAVDDVSFRVERGEVVGVLGPNGAGKTTTLRILAGFLPATAGAAQVAGFDVLRESLQARRHIGYLPESVPLYREHRVVEMLRFQARLHGLSRAETKKRIPIVLERVGLTDRARDLIGNLSRGLRQRAGLAVALLPEPDVLILDEPTSGLDPLQRIEVRALVRELAPKHTVLLSSHILPEIEAVCPRVIIMHQGKIAADGTPADLVAKLAHASHVRIEAVVGADLAGALRLLSSIGGVRSVEDKGRLGIHHQFEVYCDHDLREDVGAIAAARGWALRELSWRRPTLEEIFARIAFRGEGEKVIAASPTVSSTTTIASIHSGQSGTPRATANIALDVRLAPIVPGGPQVGDAKPSATTSPEPAAAKAPSETAPPARVVYNLNPFDRGATRNLSAPKAVEPPPATPGASPGAPPTKS
ncbi:MAG: ATP-binding cassette domain-containing protein [Planctomycetota bacterium]